jgi:hypothetical protein
MSLPVDTIPRKSVPGLASSGRSPCHFGWPSDNSRRNGHVPGEPARLKSSRAMYWRMKPQKTRSSVPRPSNRTLISPVDTLFCLGESFFLTRRRADFTGFVPSSLFSPSQSLPRPMDTSRPDCGHAAGDRGWRSGSAGSHALPVVARRSPGQRKEDTRPPPPRAAARATRESDWGPATF